MPYVEILWKPEQLDESLLEGLCIRLQQAVGAALTQHDPDHPVTPEMVDVRVGLVGPHDRIGPDLYVTVLARTEPARDAGKAELVVAITEAVHDLGVPEDTLVELVLTNRVSTYDYRDR